MSAGPADPSDARAGAGALDAQITRFLDGVRFVERRLRNAVGIAAVAGGIDTILGVVIDWRAGVAVAVVVLATIAVLLVYRRRLARLLASEAEMRADLKSGAVTPEVRERLQHAVRGFDGGGLHSRLGAARGVGQALRGHPVATRATRIRRALAGPSLPLTGWALALTGLFMVAIVPLAVVAAVVRLA